jgi:hypothetical protein
MAAGDFVVGGTSTLVKSAPGEKARLTVTATGCVADNWVFLTPLTTIPEGRDGFGVMTFHVENITTDAFDIVSDRFELDGDVDFNWQVIAHA